jgi:peptide deformylase
VAADLLETMREHPGCVGLAAPQIGHPVRVIAVDVSGHRRVRFSHGELVLLNPRVAFARGGEVAREGCLSIPHLTANVRRPTDVVVEATDLSGARRWIGASAFEARCLLHEIDHLDGVLFLDRVDSLSRDVFRRRGYR